MTSLICISPPSLYLTMNGATTPPSSSAIRPRRSSDWDEFRPIIERLYRNNQLKLKDVKEIMERDYNFVASYCCPHPPLV